MNTLHLTLVGLSLGLTATAQTLSGHINYEVMQRVDMSQVRMVIAFVGVEGNSDLTNPAFNPILFQHADTASSFVASGS